MKGQILMPDPGRLIEGLRDTGYNFDMALADIVDNAVDAGADKIDVRIELEQGNEPFVSVADNGCGMNRDELVEAMKYGAKANPDPKRLGKFGLGMKTASSAFCRKLSVISRGSDGKASKAIWDLDHVVEKGAWEILVGDPTRGDLRMLDETTEGGTGTLVIWNKVDRMISRDGDDASVKSPKAKINNMTKKFQRHLERTYHRYLDANDDRARDISISLNTVPLKAHDPFRRDEPHTDHVGSDERVVRFENGKESSFILNAYILPRPEDFTDPADGKAEIKTKDQGIYVYRENRIISMTDWLGFYSIEPHKNLLRVELSFDHTADDIFNVDIKKSRILLNETLAQYIGKWLGGPVREAEKRYRAASRKKTTNKDSLHSDSNNKIRGSEKELQEYKATNQNPDKGTADIENQSGITKGVRITILGNPGDNEMNVVPVPQLNEGVLWEPALVDNHHAVLINQTHPYYERVYLPHRKITGAITGLDYILWALSEAEMSVCNEETKGAFEDMRFQVSRIARKLANTLPEPVEDPTADENSRDDEE